MTATNSKPIPRTAHQVLLSGHRWTSAAGAKSLIVPQARRRNHHGEPLMISPNRPTHAAVSRMALGLHMGCLRISREHAARLHFALCGDTPRWCPITCQSGNEGELERALPQPGARLQPRTSTHTTPPAPWRLFMNSIHSRCSIQMLPTGLTCLHNPRKPLARNPPPT